MTKYKVKIGLEMHCEISKTNTKVFSSARNSYTDTPNINVRPIDMAFPGTLPVVNKEAVRLALMASIILGCKQPEYLCFERKNYYYPDLPKGFQITQEEKPNPVGIYGKVEIDVNGTKKSIRINNIHLEEDTASLDHYDKTSNLNYNRAGVPLLELVTEPDINNAEEAVAFLEHMRMIYQYAGISEADSKKGQVRCDVNVSIMDADLDEADPNNWGTKIEIKNVNSFGAVADAIEYEVNRQITLKDEGLYDTMEQETRRWDEESATTVFMRSKVDAIDYKYFVEPNIPKFKITEDWLKEIKAAIPELAHERKEKYITKFNLSEYDANVIIKDKSISDYFEECLSLGIDAKQAANWVTVNIIGELNHSEITIDEFFITPTMLKQITDAINKDVISSKQAKEIFIKAVEEKKEPKEFISEDNAQISDVNTLEPMIDEILNNNQAQVEQYKNGRTNLLGFFVGQVMKQTGGKANPKITNELLLNKLK